ncbi:MAG: aspartyl protease family protein [Candidatus Latescibacterota bacterium]
MSGATVAVVPLLLDTGADTTLLPRAAVERLGVAPLPDKQYELVGYDGSRSFAPVVVVDMVFLNRVLRGRYLLTDDRCGVLGRDVLNLFAVLFDGPQEQWSEHSGGPMATA